MQRGYDGPRGAHLGASRDGEQQWSLLCEGHVGRFRPGGRGNANGGGADAADTRANSHTYNASYSASYYASCDN